MIYRQPGEKQRLDEVISRETEDQLYTTCIEQRHLQ